MLFGRRKPGFSKEVSFEELDLSGEFSDRNDPAMDKYSSPKEEKQGMAEQAAETAGVALAGVGTEAPQAPDGNKPDLFEYMESLPEVEDPFEPMAETSEEPEPELKPGELLAEYIRARTRAVLLTARKPLEAEEPELQTLLDEMASLESCQDIRSVKGQKDEYYYSEEIMANNYAMIAMLVEEKDIAHTIAHMVRFNCKTYPSPTPYYYFSRSPYNFSDAEIIEAVRVILENEETKDIKHIRAFNDCDYLYSEEYMSYKYAKALADGGEAGEADF